MIVWLTLFNLNQFQSDNLQKISQNKVIISFGNIQGFVP